MTEVSPKQASTAHLRLAKATRKNFDPAANDCSGISPAYCVHGEAVLILDFLEHTMIRLFGFLLTCAISTWTMAQVPFPQLPPPVATFAMEDQDWSVASTTTPKRHPYHGQTPMTIPGARVIKALELKGLLADNKNVVVVDVLDSRTRKSIPDAVWMSGAGGGQFYAAEKSRFAAALETLTAGDKARPLVFLCVSSECWLSYNAALHALDAGYQDVIWFRGGTDAWRGANLKLKSVDAFNW